MKLTLVQWLVALLQNDKIWSPDTNVLTGTNRNNRIVGESTSSNLIAGFGGNDVLIGGSLSDTLIGGDGVDVLTGGSGADKFVIERSSTLNSSTADKITDFSVSDGDKILIDRNLFPNVSTTVSVVAAGGSRSIQSSRLRSALSSSSSFVYNASTGELWWNQNGSSSGAGQGGIIAILTNKPATLTSAVIELI